MTVSLMRLMDQNLHCLLLGREFLQQGEFVLQAQQQWPSSNSVEPVQQVMGLRADTDAVPFAQNASSSTSSDL